MEIQVKINVSNEESKIVTERLVKENLENKLANYLKKYESRESAKWLIEIKIEKNKKDRFDGVIHATLDGETFRYSRDDYKKLDDLINNLFDHFKEELSSK